MWYLNADAIVKEDLIQIERKNFLVKASQLFSKI